MIDFDADRFETFEVYPVRFVSGDERPREASPEGWYPEVANVLVYDDELDEIPAGVWFQYFAGGHNGQHYVLRDEEGDFYFVDGAFASYELACPNGGGGHYNVYDAFWTAERLARVGEDYGHNFQRADDASGLAGRG